MTNKQQKVDVKNVVADIVEGTERLRRASKALAEYVSSLPPLPGLLPEGAWDMETAIKGTQQWECGALHCRNCDREQNLECLETYQIQVPPRVTRLHVDHGGQDEGLPEQSSSREANAKETAKRKYTINRPRTSDPTKMKRPQLVKLASQLGLGKTPSRPNAKLVQFIRKHQQQRRASRDGVTRAAAKRTKKQKPNRR